MKYYTCLAVIDDDDRGDWLIEQFLKTKQGSQPRCANIGRIWRDGKVIVVDCHPYGRSKNVKLFNQFVERMNELQPYGHIDSRYCVEKDGVEYIVDKCTRVAIGIIEKSGHGWTTKYYKRERFGTPYLSLPF